MIRVVVVGAGFAGLEVAKGLARSPCEVLLVDRRNHHLFQPLLYQVATAALSPANIAVPIRGVFRRQHNCRVLLGEVEDIALADREVDVAGHRFAWDYLVLATGSRTFYFGHDDWAEHAPGLKDIDEAIELRRRFLLAYEDAELEDDAERRAAIMTFAIVGAGPTGVEMAGALAEIGRKTLTREFRRADTRQSRVVLLDLAGRVLPGMSPSSSARAAADLEALGVELRLGTRVLGVDAAGLDLEGPEGTGRIETGNVVWAAGVRASPLGEVLGLRCDRQGRVEVGDDLSVPGHPGLFVVGDLAARVDPVTAAQVPGVAQGAIQMGRFVAALLRAELAARAAGRPAPQRGCFVYRDKGTMATIGRNRAVAEIRGLRFGGTPAWLCWALLHLWFLVGFRRRFLTFFEWTWSYLFHSRGVRLITGRDGARDGDPGSRERRR